MGLVSYTRTYGNKYMYKRINTYLKIIKLMYLQMPLVLGIFEGDAVFEQSKQDRNINKTYHYPTSYKRSVVIP